MDTIFIAVLTLNVSPDLMNMVSSWQQHASVFAVGLIVEVVPPG